MEKQMSDLQELMVGSTKIIALKDGDLSIPKEIKAQLTAIITKAGMSLSILILCSRVMAKYPTTNTMIIADSILCWF